jgi:hypothetical protein
MLFFCALQPQNATKDNRKSPFVIFETTYDQNVNIVYVFAEIPPFFLSKNRS